MVHLDTFRPGSLYYEWFLHVDKEGGIFRSRWGDAPIRTLGVLVSVPAHQILDLRGHMDYMHAPLLTCAKKPEFLGGEGRGRGGGRGGGGGAGLDAEGGGSWSAYSFMMNRKSGCCVDDVASECDKFVACESRPEHDMCAKCDLLPQVCVAVYCSVLQRVAVCCSVLQCSPRMICARSATCFRRSMLQCVAVCCSVLQCVAVLCNVLQCVAVCCSVLQCVAACYSIVLS